MHCMVYLKSYKTGRICPRCVAPNPKMDRNSNIGGVPSFLVFERELQPKTMRWSNEVNITQKD